MNNNHGYQSYESDEVLDNISDKVDFSNPSSSHEIGILNRVKDHK